MERKALKDIQSKNVDACHCIVIPQELSRVGFLTTVLAILCRYIVHTEFVVRVSHNWIPKFLSPSRRLEWSPGAVPQDQISLHARSLRWSTSPAFCIFNAQDVRKLPGTAWEPSSGAELDTMGVHSGDHCTLQTTGSRELRKGYGRTILTAQKAAMVNRLYMVRHRFADLNGFIEAGACSNDFLPIPCSSLRKRLEWMQQFVRGTSQNDRMAATSTGHRMWGPIMNKVDDRAERRNCKKGKGDTNLRPTCLFDNIEEKDKVWTERGFAAEEMWGRWMQSLMNLNDSFQHLLYILRSRGLYALPGGDCHLGFEHENSQSSKNIPSWYILTITRCKDIYSLYLWTFICIRFLSEKS